MRARCASAGTSAPRSRGRQLTRIKAAHQVDEAARIRVVANRCADRGAVGVLHRTARHLHRLLRFLRVVKVDGGVGQQQWRQRRHALAQVAGVEQCQLARRMAQPCHDLGLAAYKTVLVGLPGALFFVLEHHHAQRHRGQGQQHKHTAHQNAQAESWQAQAGHLQTGDVKCGMQQALHVGIPSSGLAHCL